MFVHGERLILPQYLAYYYQTIVLCVGFTLEILDPKSDRVAKQTRLKATRKRSWVL